MPLRTLTPRCQRETERTRGVGRGLLHSTNELVWHLATHSEGHRRKIGGDGFDISTWSSAERKQYNFDNQDPLPKTIKSLGKGLVLVLG
ncbi:hypothetical protein EDB80DRAFT_316617 [Ilyonectria destructans]|nr:hypothetical protein EDB80DRAFT_316617 [Ilyonectria destructans]